MKQVIKHGASIDTLTPTEARAILASVQERDSARRVRATAIVALDANGNGQDEVYNPPVGFEFEARRVFLDLDTATDPVSGRVLLGTSGTQSTNLVANPAAGADWSFVVPAGKVLSLVSASAQLQSSAVVANRLVNFQILDNSGDIIWQNVRPFQQAAGATARYAWAQGANDDTAASNSTQALPTTLLLRPGWTVRVVTAALDVGDQWSGINLVTADQTSVGKSVDYLRSGTRIQYANPEGPTGENQIPGLETWGAEQGPYFRNGEVFEVRAAGLTPGARLSVSVEGVLRKPASPSTG